MESSNNNPPIPIFVLGVQRSGTTWLANQLSQHDDVAGITHADHHGIHESGFFELIDGRYGDLRIKGNFVEFAEVMLASDYFSLAGVDRPTLYALYGQNYPQIFREVMDRFARNSSAAFWVEKSPGHTRYAKMLSRYYPDACFITIKRDVTDVVNSAFARRGDGVNGAFARYQFVAKRVHRWVLYNRIIDEFSASQPKKVLKLDYAELLQEQERTMNEVCDFVGLKFQTSMVADTFSRDSSFGSRDRKTLLTRSELVWIRVVRTFLSILPISMLSRFRKKRSGVGSRPLPLWFFRVSRSSGNDDSEFGKSKL